MILYHFTALERLPAISRDGRSRGDVPLSPTEGVVPPSQFTEVLIRREYGAYTPVTAADHAEAEAAIV